MMQLPWNPARWSGVVLAAVGLLLSSGFAQAQEGKLWVALIGLKQHDDRSLNLSFTEADVSRLRSILVERAGLSSDRLLQLTDSSPAAQQPTLSNLRRELPAFLGKLSPEDRLILFFSGHGVQHNHQTYLVPRDLNRQRVAETGLPIAEVRELLQACPARLKLLILDCCHAAGERDAAKEFLPTETVAQGLQVKGIKGCVVLASCRADEKSWEWVERKQGVFTYWLCRALEGAAADDRGQVTLDKINQYLYTKVPKTTQHVFEQSQTPVRLGSVEGNPVVLTLRPEQPESVCRRLAEELDLVLRDPAHKIKTVGVLEFLRPIGKVEKLGAATVPAFLSEQIRLTLTVLAGSGYRVLTEESMKSASRGLAVEAIGDRDRMEPLRTQGKLDAVISGSLRQRGKVLSVQVEVISVDTGESLAKFEAVLPLSEELVGDWGGSFSNLKRPNGNSPFDPAVVAHVLREQHTNNHPLLSLDFPFRIKVFSQTRPGEPRREKELIGLPPSKVQGELPPSAKQAEVTRDLLMAVREGELLEIVIDNKYGQRVGMTLLVDGLNTLGQKRERLGAAWSWVLEPGRSYTIDGWYVPKTPQAKPGHWHDFTRKRFQVVDVADSVAGRSRFTDSMGVITAAFYAERGRALGIGEGPEETRSLRTVNFHPGRLLAVVQIRYVDEAELKKLLQK